MKTILILLQLMFITIYISAQTGTTIIPEVTMINNSGVLIKIGDKKILLDALTLEVPDSVNNKIINGISPFDNINLICVSHTDFDHFDSSLIASFMENHTESKLFTNSICLNALSATRLSHFQNRVVKINDQSSTTQTFSIDGMQLRTINYGELPFYCNYSGIAFLHMADAYYIRPGLIPTNQKLNFILAPLNYLNYTDAIKYKTEHCIRIHYNPVNNNNPDMQTDRKIDDVIYLYFHKYIETKQLVKSQDYKPSYLVQFDGSSVGYSNIANVDSGKVVQTPQIYSINYTFTAWYKEPEKTNEWIFLNDVVTKHTTLYGKDSIKTRFTVNFNSNGGAPVASQTVNYYSFVTIPIAPIKSGYTFVGWYENSALTQLWDFSTRRIFFNITLYAKWSIASSVVAVKDDESGISLYPNPAKDKLYVSNIKLSKSTIVVFNLHGEQVMNKEINSNPIDISMLSNGVYVVKIVSKENTIYSKLLKQ